MKRESYFGVGVDCDEIERWRRLLPELESGASRRLFTKAEHTYCKSFKDPAPHYAARWCGKEAVAKAISSRCKLDIRRIEILNDSSGKPAVVSLGGGSAELLPLIEISLSHSKHTAMAFALLLLPN